MKQTPSSDQIAVAEKEFCDAFRRDYPFWWLTTLLVPLLSAIVLCLVVGFTGGVVQLHKVLLTAAATFFFFGKFVILGSSPLKLFALVVYMDVMTGMLLVFHAGFLFRIPYLGSRILVVARDSQQLLAGHPWIRRATFVGITLFVMFPLAATGAVGAAIFGRLLGMSRMSTFLAICLGSIMGCGVMVYGSVLIDQYIGRENPMLTIGGLAVIISLILLLNYRYRKMKKTPTGPMGPER
ncbi:MAG: small multi-drug export protein [Pirellulales bacterium]|nr:small multi-drug export protein [Pirellulales bacterium]